MATCEGAAILDLTPIDFKARVRCKLASIETPHQRKKARIKAHDPDGVLNGLTNEKRPGT